MSYLSTIRKVHLWLGLILAVFLLVVSISGLILSEPALIGANKTYPADHLAHINSEKYHAGQKSYIVRAGSELSEDVSKLVFIKQLHQGIVYDISFRWLIDIVAISIIILTLTGIYLAIPFLKFQFKRSNPNNTKSV